MRIKLFMMLLFLIMALAGARSADSRDDGTFRVGATFSVFSQVNQNDAKAVLKSWFNAITREKGLKIQSDVLLYERTEDLRKAFLQNRLEAAVLSVEDILTMKLKLDFIYIPSMEQGATVRYAVVVRRDGGIKNLGDLKGRKVSTYEKSTTILAKPWFESLMTTSRDTKWVMTDNPSKSVMQVFFKQADAALVTLGAFDLVCEMNPQVKTNLRVLSVSEPFVSVGFIFNPAFKGTVRDEVEEAMMDLQNTPSGQQVLTVFQASRMEKHPVSIMDTTVQFLAKHKGSDQKMKTKGSRP